MKKVFIFMALAAMVAVACSKPSQKKGNHNNDGDDVEYVQPIEVDGDFADWAKLDASKIASAKLDPEADKTALQEVKVYADEVFVFVYIKFDKSQIEMEPDVEHVPFHMYINGDGDAATGGYGDEFLDACSDIMLEGFLTDGTDFVSYEPSAWKWSGEANGTGWTWEETNVTNGFAKGAGKGSEYEFALLRELYPAGKLADTFSIGFDIQQGWESVGVLPIAHVTDENPSGYTNSLQVVTVK